MTTRVLVTGATGFIGRVLCQELHGRGCVVRAAVRQRTEAPTKPPIPYESEVVGDLGAKPDWSSALAGVTHVIHCAAQTAASHAVDPDAERLLSNVNVDATSTLALAAAAAGVRRMVFVSSIKVNGELTRPGEVFSGHDRPDPQDAYARSKLRAETALWDLAASSSLEVVVVRPPLVFGSGAKGNLAVLIRALRYGVPLPLGAVRNKRALLGVGSLAHLLAACLTAPVAGRTLLAREDEELSTPEMLACIAEGLGVRARLIPVPLWLLKAVGAAVGRGADVDRVVGSLQVDDSETRTLTGWQPREPARLGLQEMVHT